MSVYVGIDVHRKRSQVAVVAEDGQVQLNKNVVNGSEPMLRLSGDLPSGMPVASGAAFGWGWLARLSARGADVPLPVSCASGSRSARSGVAWKFVSRSMWVPVTAGTPDAGLGDRIRGGSAR